MALALTSATRAAGVRPVARPAPGMRPAARRVSVAPAARATAAPDPTLDDLRARVKETKAELKSLKAALKREEKAARAAAESDSSSSSSSSSSSDDDMKAGGAAAGDEATTAVLKVSVSELVADAAAKAAHRRKAGKGGHAAKTVDSARARAATSPADLAAAAATLPHHPRSAAPVASATAAPPPSGAMDASSPLVIHTPRGPALSVSAAAASAAAPTTTVLKVCTGAACRRLGSATLLARLRAEHDGPVRACSCLGRCGRSRAEAASDGEAEVVASWWAEQEDDRDGDGGLEPFAAGPGGAVAPLV